MPVIRTRHPCPSPVYPYAHHLFVTMPVSCLSPCPSPVYPYAVVHFHRSIWPLELLQLAMNYIELPKESCFTPVYSPRTSLSQINGELDRLATNLAINIDKYILGFFKDAFEQQQDEMGRDEFISQGLRHLKSWQRELKHRNVKITQSLARLFEEADSTNQGTISWSQFNSMLIEKCLNLKTLRNQEPGSTALMKPVCLNGSFSKHGSPIQKMVCLNSKIALFTEESSEVLFFNLDGTPASLKPLVLSQQSLTVETSISKRTKTGKKELLKKELVVAEYKNVLLDMIYINDGKYDMLITSSTDFIVRGWDISSNMPTLAKQPENEDEKMQHQFTEEVHTMSWDNVNEILYCCGKSPVIREWMVKTDSERELSEAEGHSEMISAMIMMPKLQFLATGGYDGRLILWDTISQTRKFKYKEHTRSISSMAFHEGLILLFTAAFDHSICVWNPYIQSLVHKIISNVNFIQLDVIPDTNLLIALDADSNVRIREVSKFTLVSSFTIDKHDHRSEPISMIATPKPLRYFFGGLSVSAFEYIHIDANVILDSTALCLRYHPHNFTLYCPIKNHLVAWGLLTGSISNTLRNQSSAEITAFDTFLVTKVGVVGDAEGNLLLRKLENGVLVKQLYKHKTNVICVLVEEVSRQKKIFSASYDGEVAIFEKDFHGEFNYGKSLSIRKINPHATVTALCYQSKRNTLIIGTSGGEIYFMDIDKNKLISKCETNSGDIERFVHFSEENLLLSFTKKAEIFGLYLPPHIKKFKPSCHLISQQASAKINCVGMSLKNKRCYIGFENGDLMCFWLNQDTVARPGKEDQEGAQGIRHVWKCNFGESVRNLILIQSQDTLVAIVGANNILLVACESGDQLAELNEKYQENESPPILFLDEEKDAVYIRSLDTSIPIKTISKEQEVRRFLDPSFYLNLVEAYHDKINTVSNPRWRFHPNIQNETKRIIDKTMKLLVDIEEYEKQPKRLRLVRAEFQSTFDVSKAAELQKRWQRQKEEEEFMKTEKQQSLHIDKQNSYLVSNTSSSGVRLTKQSYLSRSHQRMPNFRQSDNPAVNNPLYRLGAALRNVDEQDTKALGLMEMAERQYLKSKGSTVKLPNISSHKK